jgi:hypothetical protein
MQENPIRFVLPVCGCDQRLTWRIFVRGRDEQQVYALSAEGNLVTEATVRGWFGELATRWPKPSASDLMAAFVVALNVLRVTRSKTVAELQSRTLNHAESARRTARVKAAMNTLALDLPPMLDAAGSKVTIPYSDDQMFKLVVLARAAKDAQGIIVAPRPPHKETSWHETAHLIDWHMRQVLAQLGVAEVGNDSKGPLVGIVKAAIAAVEGLSVSEDAISKALQRGASTGIHIQTLEWAESQGYKGVG